jgi:hypothetical protein
MVRNMMARTPGPHILARSQLVMALTNGGANDEAMPVGAELLNVAETIANPNTKALALNAYAWAYRDADPVGAYDVGLRALNVAHDSGNRFMESTISINLSRLAVSHGDAMEAFDYLLFAIRNYQESGSFLLITGPLAMIAVLLDRYGRHDAAATLMEFGDVPSTRPVFPEVDSAIAHLREVLGDQAYQSFVRAGARMTTAAVVAYAHDQIEQARAQLKTVSQDHI